MKMGAKLVVATFQLVLVQPKTALDALPYHIRLIAEFINVSFGDGGNVRQFLLALCGSGGEKRRQRGIAFSRKKLFGQA
jgi:hypothetical protein